MSLSRPGILPPLLCSLAVAVGSRLRVVGLTGGIACGKSAAVQRMRELNVPVVDADAIAHQVLRKGTATHARVVATFAKYPGVVGADGDIDRAALRSLVFGDRALNRMLKQCTHRAIALEMVRQLLTHSLLRRAPLVVLDAPLLFESRADLLCKQAHPRPARHTHTPSPPAPPSTPPHPRALSRRGARTPGRPSACTARRLCSSGG